ncbi:MAG: phospholipid carrier-dependent glycosyltransferase [Chloroflexi bacterium]|nr:phospholipid carrier-dependent glycosyltransferase [Chloroflexota bacterium]
MKFPVSKIKISREWIALGFILLIAILFRAYALDRLPPGLFGDEAVEGLDALDVLAGNWQIWFHAHLGREPIFVYLVALAYAAFGVTALATRFPAILAGIVTIPIAYWFTREWAHEIFSAERARRIALLVAALLAISFWHIQMSRDAHRDILLPLVQAIGYAFLWRAFRTREWKLFAAAGAVLGLALYTYSPGRFVGVFVALFIVGEFFLARATTARAFALEFNWRGVMLAAVCALIVMLPLGIYFAQNPAQFSRRFDSVSILGANDPLAALTASIAGNLAMFALPDAGYQSRHYNLPGKPVFDLFLAPFFLIGVIISLMRFKRAQYRFLILWFAVMLVPAFLTADMIPKGVRDLGVMPGVFIFPALAMDELFARVEVKPIQPQRAVRAFIASAITASALLTAYDYFFAWANLSDLPHAFDQEYVDVSQFVRQQPANSALYISAEVYRHPTFMLLGKQIPTSKYFERATRVRELDARSALIANAQDVNARYIFLRGYAPSDAWLARVAVSSAPLELRENFSILQLARLAPPKQTTDLVFNPWLKLVGYTRFADQPRGLALDWQVLALPDDRVDMQTRAMFFDSRNQLITDSAHQFSVPPMEWNRGDEIVEWYETDAVENAAQFSIQLQRNESKWTSPTIPLK